VETRKVGLLGGGYIAKTAGGGKNLRRQHSQANQEYHNKRPQFPVVLIPGQTHRLHFLRFSVLVTVELAKAESKPRDQQKGPTKEALSNGWCRNASRGIESDLLWTLKSHTERQRIRNTRL
jgi:hypothetical protein